MIFKDWNKDLLIKIVSLLLSIFMWLFVINVQNPETTVTVSDIPIEYINKEATDDFGLIMTNDSVENLTLKLSGKRKTVSILSNENIRAYADLAGINRSGEFPVMIQVELPLDDVKIIDKNPYNINIKLDSIKEVQKNISVVALGTVKDPYVALEPIVSPNLVTITGPSSVINSIDSVKVKVDIQDNDKDIITSQSIEYYNTENKKIVNSNIKADVDNVNVIYPIKMKKIVPIEVNTSGMPYGSYVVEEVSLDPKAVNIVGDENIISGIDRVYTETIDIYGLNEDKEIDVLLNLPKGVDMYKSNSMVTVSIDVGKEIIRTISVDNINIYNLPEDLSYNLFTEQINVTLKGMEENLKDITADDILANINLSTYDEGEHVVPVDIVVKSDIKVLGSYNALVKLKRQVENIKVEPTEEQENVESNETSSEEIVQDDTIEEDVTEEM